MDIGVFTGPSPGAAKPGNLYADLQSRTLWLGVDPAVDPNQAVLISDIMGTQTDIDGAVTTANAYTDTQILTRAPTTHTHTSSQITDFTSAVTGIVNSVPGISYVHGMILMYSGSLANVGTGALAGWSVCDGSNGTPDLRDKFIIGAGNKPVGATNSGAALTTDAGGGHDHTVNATVLTLAQIPAHSHGGNTGINSVGHTHTVSVSGSTDTQGDHSHTYTRGGTGANSYATGGTAPAPASSPNIATGTAGAHAHNVSASGTTSGISANHTHAIPVDGSGQGHAHTLVGGGGVHQHVITSAQLREASPYYALAFIMKL